MPKNVAKILKTLKPIYENSKTELNHKTPFQLLVSVILSAQCTDIRVNLVTPNLFKKYPTVAKMAKAELIDIEKLIHSTGFYHNKAKSIKETSVMLIKDFGGKVPNTMEQLLTLKGVARKTANVVLSEVFGLAEGFVVDTHVKRLTNRMGLTKNSNPEKIEQDMMKLLNKKDWRWFSMALVLHGRRVCPARKPNCEQCPITKFCPKIGVSTTR
jgi:endonuclease-3